MDIQPIRLLVCAQEICVTQATRLVARSTGVCRAAFQFDDTWEGYAKVAVFLAGGKTREVLLTGESCVIPGEMLMAGQSLRIGVYGTKGEDFLPTVWAQPLPVFPGAFPTEEAEAFTPTLSQQVLGTLGDLSGLDTENKASLVAAINEVLAKFQAPISVQSAALEENGHLIFTLSNGEMLDAGYAQGPQGAAGPRGDTGPRGADGQSPVIGANGNWFLGGHDTGVSASGDRVQPDWAQNDTNALNYIQNRPFFDGVAVDLLVFSQAVSLATNAQGLPQAKVAAMPLLAGQSYKVLVDGTEYLLRGKADGQGRPYVGNPAITGVGSDSGQSFLIVYDETISPDGGYIVTTDGTITGTISLKLYETGDGIVKLPARFLPMAGEALGGVKAVPATSDMTQKVGIDEAGNLLTAPGGVQPDWNQNDPAQSGYIQNRPFYTEGDDAPDILPETALNDILNPEGWTYNADNAMWMATSPVLQEEVVVGDAYTVICDGTSYHCTATEIALDVDAAAVVLGNADLMEGTGDTGEPFVAVFIPAALAASMGGYAMAVSTTGASAMTLTIRKGNQVIHKIPEKYLPSFLGAIRLQGSFLPEAAFVSAMTACMDGKAALTLNGLRVAHAELQDTPSSNGKDVYLVRFAIDPFHTIRYIHDGTGAYFTYDAYPSGALAVPQSGLNVIGADNVVTGKLVANIGLGRIYLRTINGDGTVTLNQHVFYPLPAFTAGENGKVLGIENGALAWVSV